MDAWSNLREPWNSRQWWFVDLPLCRGILISVGSSNLPITSNCFQRNSWADNSDYTWCLEASRSSSLGIETNLNLIQTVTSSWLIVCSMSWATMSLLTEWELWTGSITSCLKRKRLHKSSPLNFVVLSNTSLQAESQIAVSASIMLFSWAWTPSERTSNQTRKPVYLL